MSSFGEALAGSAGARKQHVQHPCGDLVQRAPVDPGIVRLGQEQDGYAMEAGEEDLRDEIRAARVRAVRSAGAAR
jgi:hypothetical protein